jgi:hypothetical protein
MKHLLLILISFLLLSSPVIGDEPVVLYQYETSTGIKWKTFGDGKVQPKYNGEIKNGLMDGLGVLTYPYGEKSVVGEWKNGKEWNTKHTKKDGTLLGKIEKGVWLDGELIESWGVLYHGLRNGERGWYEEKGEGGNEGGNNKNWWKFEGKIMNGKPKEGTYVSYTNKDKYVGEFKDGKRNGQGTYLNYFYNQKYVGEFKDGDYDGQGTMTWSSGEKYVGEYKFHKEWNGTQYDKDGNIIGKYENGKYIEQ